MSRGKVLGYTLVVRHPDTDAPTALLAGKKVPSWAKELVDEGNLVDGTSDEDDSSDDTSPKPPTKADMLAEIEKRNADRSDEDKIVPTSEKNADLAAALKADDEKSA
jgi:hypothetical protein